MAKQDQERHHQQKALSIPTEQDCGNYHDDLDQRWAHDHYLGRSNDEMQAYYANAPLEGASDLRFLPEVPFRYYMLEYRDFMMSANNKDRGGREPLMPSWV